MSHTGKKREREEGGGEMDTWAGAGHEVKGVCRTNLSWAEEQGMSTRVAVQEEERKQRCMLYRLLTDNSAGGLAALDRFVDLTEEALKEQKVLPIDPHGVRDTDAPTVDEMFRFMRETPLVTYKRQLIIVVLMLSPQFCDNFCPHKPAPGARFLCDPEKLVPVATGAVRPVVDLFSRVLVTDITAADFVTEFARIWSSLKPWRNYETWSAYVPGEASTEAKVHAGEPLSDAQRASAALYLTGGVGGPSLRSSPLPPPLPAAPAVGLLEYGAPVSEVPRLM